MLTGIITQTDLSRAFKANEMDRPVSEFSTRQLVTTYPEQPLNESVGKFVELNQMPVVDRRGRNHLIGMLTRADLLKPRASETTGPAD